jgi:uncharacterized membrane protein
MNPWARYLNVIVGIWLVVSAFMWPHSESQMTNAWVVGALAAIFAIIAATRREDVRYLNTALAVWLFISIFVLPTVSVATLWNHGIVAAVMFVVSLIPNIQQARTGRTATTRRSTATATPAEHRI